MIIELAGPPGAGKSSLVPELLRHLDAWNPRHVDITDRIPTSRFSLRRKRLYAAATNPALALSIIRMVGPGRAAARRATAVATHDLELRRLRRGSGAVLVDEGPVHTLLWSLALLGYMGARWPDSRWLTTGSIIVYVRIAPEVAVAREADGSDSVLAGVNRIEGLALVQRYDRLALALLPRLDSEVVVIDGSDAPSTGQLDRLAAAVASPPAPSPTPRARRPTGH